MIWIIIGMWRNILNTWIVTKKCDFSFLDQAEKNYIYFNINLICENKQRRQQQKITLIYSILLNFIKFYFILFFTSFQFVFFLFIFLFFFFSSKKIKVNQVFHNNTNIITNITLSMPIKIYLLMD